MIGVGSGSDPLWDYLNRSSQPVRVERLGLDSDSDDVPDFWHAVGERTPHIMESNWRERAQEQGFAALITEHDEILRRAVCAAGHPNFWDIGKPTIVTWIRNIPSPTTMREKEIVSQRSVKLKMLKARISKALVRITELNHTAYWAQNILDGRKEMLARCDEIDPTKMVCVSPGYSAIYKKTCIMMVENAEREKCRVATVIKTVKTKILTDKKAIRKLNKQITK